MRVALLGLASLCTLAFLLLPAPSAETPAKPVANFTLNDTAGQPWSLEGQKDKKAVVVVFLGTECPINNAYSPSLAELYNEFRKEGVAFVAVNANRHDTPARIAAHAREHGIPFPVLKDTAGTVADSFGARRTPEVFLLNGQRQIVYQGRIDDQFGIGFKRVKPTRRDLAAAIDEVLSGKPVSVAKTTVAGCLIDRAATPKADGPVTYAKQVSRVIQKNCQECHRPGQIGPMPLMTYEDAVAWSDNIREVIMDRRMPPWNADPRLGDFANDRSLQPEDRAALRAWLDGGCPKGDDKDLPPPRAFAEGWAIGKPDVVFTMPEAYVVPATAGERGIEYQNFTVETHFTKDMWVQAAEAKPGDRSVVHHIIVFIRPPEGHESKDKDDQTGSGYLTGYAPGDMPSVFEPGTARKVPRGSTLIFQMHYTPSGVETEDRSSVGLIFAKSPPKREVRTRGIENHAFKIPRGEKNYEVKATTTFRRDADLLGFMPHMHLRGKDFEYRIIYPNGGSELLMRVPRYDFGWQSAYRLKRPLKMPAGTRIECVAHFDNSADNPNNPDPTKEVTWGEQTWDEMMIGFVDYAYTGTRSLR